jgi:hypothetical protein
MMLSASSSADNGILKCDQPDILKTQGPTSTQQSRLDFLDFHQ